MNNYSIKYSWALILMMLAWVIVTPLAFANYMDKGSSAKKIEKLRKELVLTEDQTNKVKAICDDVSDRMQALHKEKHDRISALLTAEQQVKYEKKINEWKEKHN